MMDLCGNRSANNTVGEDDKAAKPDADILILQAVLPITMDWCAGPGQVLGRWPVGRFEKSKIHHRI